MFLLQTSRGRIRRSKRAGGEDRTDGLFSYDPVLQDGRFLFKERPGRIGGHRWGFERRFVRQTKVEGKLFYSVEMLFLDEGFRA